jgi:hypothetical protein
MAREFDPMTVIGIRICLQKMAKDAGAGSRPEAALEWSLRRGYLRVNHAAESETNDLILTSEGQQAVAAFYKTHRQAAAARGLVLPPGVRMNG